MGRTRVATGFNPWFPVPWILAGALLAACGGQDDRLNVLLITLDTTRADHLGCYGHDAIETPAIDRLAAEGTLYERCYTPVPITLPSHLSILTGTYPVYHGVHENAGFYVAEELTTLAEILERRGYATAAFVGAYPLDSQTGLDHGFDLYDDNYPSSLEEGKHPGLRGFFDERPAAEVARPAMAWIDQRNGEPFFLWTHFFDPHQPQIPPPPYRERYADALYDGEIASVDEAVGRILARLEERGLLDRTLIVLTADHGESLGDHGELTHALLLYSSTVRVPLIVRDPRQPSPRRVTVPVTTVDILPTILDRLGLEIPAAVQGRLLPADDGGAPRRQRAIFTETLYGALLHGWSPLERLTLGDWMLVHGPEPRLFQVADDPGELNDLADREPQRLEQMIGWLSRRKRQLSEGGVEAGKDSISPEKQARLAALGYLGSGGKVEISELEIGAGLPDPHQAIAVFREMNEGKQLTEAGQAALAVAVLEHAKLTDPGNPFLAMYLAMAYQQLGDAEALRREVDALLAAAPDHLGGHLLLAELLAGEGDTEGSVAALKRALELDPGNQATHLVLAHRLEDAGADAEAAEIYSRLLELAPDSTLASNGFATLVYRQGRVDEAVELLERALEQQPFYAPAHLNLAVIHHDQGEIEDSERRVRRALELRPTYGPAYELHALNLEVLGDVDGAREAWRRADRFAPDAGARRRADDALSKH
ncbi:MAG: sulfatase-like hydrolase/transferase [Thermoanaerobaculia bacterium]